MLNSIVKIAEDPVAVARVMTDDFLQLLDGGSSLNIALSGGSTPKPLFQLWASEYGQRINWTRVHLFWSDERCVPPDDPQSNFGMTRELLLRHIDIPVSNIHRICGEADPEEEVKRYAKEIQEHVRMIEGRPRLDFVMLGMGQDGHTASIFPDQMELITSQADCGIAIRPDTGQKRITLTGRAINNAVNVCFLVTGKTKARLVADIVQRPQEHQQFPAAHINPSGNLNFYLDAAAASRLIANSEFQ